MINNLLQGLCFHYNANLKSDLFENNKEPLTMTVIAAPACHCSVQKFTLDVNGSFSAEENSCTLTIKRVAAKTVQSENFAIVGGVRTGTWWRQMHLQSGNALYFTTLEL